MKHFMDIQAIIEATTSLKQSNTGAFTIGDLIQITEKVDGSNSSIQYENGVLLAFSRKQPLDNFNTLDGWVLCSWRIL